MCAAESSERWSERQAENMVLVQCDRDNPLVALGKPRDILEILREGSDRKTYPNWHGICKASADEIELLRADLAEYRRSYLRVLAFHYRAKGVTWRTYVNPQRSDGLFVAGVGRLGHPMQAIPRGVKSVEIQLPHVDAEELVVLLNKWSVDLEEDATDERQQKGTA